MDAISSLPTGSAIPLASASAETLKSTAKASKDDAKIEKSSKEFEAILLGSWLAQAENTFAKVPGGEEDEEDGATSQFTEMAMQSLGTSFAGSGGIGIAKMIAAQLHRTEGTPTSANTDPKTVGPEGSSNKYLSLTR